MPYAADMIELIDGRIRNGQSVSSKMGTVTARDSTGSRCLVSFDGSSGVSQPVKCFEDRLVFVGDRVGCVKFQSDWIVVGNYTLRTLAEAYLGWPFSAGGTTTSASYADMPQSPSVSLTKVRDGTTFMLSMSLSATVATATAVVRFGLHVGSLDGVTSYDAQLINFAFNPLATHLGFSGWAMAPQADPAGGYTITARWLRQSGTGTPTIDANDQVSIAVREVVT